jgi:flagellar biosynthesis protein FlhB
VTEEKTEQATPQRLEKARREGDGGASAYARQAVAFLVALAIVPSAVLATSSRCSAWVKAAVMRAAEHPVRVQIDPLALATDIAGLAGPAIFAAALAAGVVGVVQTGGTVATAKLAPDLAKLDPIAGLKRLLSTDRLFAVARSLLLAAAVAWLAYRQLASHALDVARTVGEPGRVAGLGGELAWRVARDAAILGLFAAALDVAIVRRSWSKRLKMSPAEIKRERKESEGDPHVKAARDRARRELLAQATLLSVKDASVVVVNPTHLACALKYTEDEDGAPLVVASGEGDLAQRIVRAARDYGVPIVRDVPLARALRELEVGEVIPEALYEAVAEILKAAWEESDPPRANE